MEESNYRERLAKARQSLSLHPDNVAQHEEILYDSLLVAEENLRAQDRAWENRDLTREFIRHAESLQPAEHADPSICSCFERMEDTLQYHPRLRLRLKESYRGYLERCGADTTHITAEIEELQGYIHLADQGRADEIPQQGFIRHDPVEWTIRWEEVIDEAEKIACERLKEHPRGMGFCFAYWGELKRVLSQRFGVVWRTPSQMNPKIHFD